MPVTVRNTRARGMGPRAQPGLNRAGAGGAAQGSLAAWAVASRAGISGVPASTKLAA